MDLNSLIAECTAYDCKVMLEEKKPKSWLKRVSSDTSSVGDHDGDDTPCASTENTQSHQRVYDNNRSSNVGDIVGEPTHHRA